MGRSAALLAVACAVATLGGGFGLPSPAAAAPSGERAYTAKQLIKRFKKATKGDRLRRDTRASWTGVAALRYGRVQSASVLARYGNFLLYVVRTKELDADVARMLADIHTAEPIAPNRKGVRWEQNVTLHGDTYWTAKKKYARNVVLVWNGGEQKGVTKAWKRLNKALVKATR